MNCKETKDFLNTIILDERLGLNELKTLIFLIDKDTFISSDITEHFNFKKPYTNKILNKLIDYGYITIAGKVKSTRILVYSFSKLKAL